MPRDIWPPKTTMIPVSILRDESIPNAACRLHLKLLALAWGGGLEMALSALLVAVSLSKTRLFEYARLLSLHGYLTWSCAKEVFKAEFADPGFPDSRIPGKRDLSSLKTLNTKDSKLIKEGGEIPKNGKAGFRESRRKKPSDPRTQSPEIQLFRAITSRYPALVNYDEVIAAAQGRTREQLEPYFREWSGRGYNPGSVKWLTEWAVSGQPPAACGKRNGHAAATRRTASNQNLLGTHPGYALDDDLPPG